MRRLKFKLTIIKEFFRHHKGATATLAFTFASYSLLKYQSTSLHKSLKIPTSVVDTEKEKQYIYLHSDKEKLLSMFYEFSGKNQVSHHVARVLKEFFPEPMWNIKRWTTKRTTDLAEVYVSPWTILQEASSKNKDIRLQAVEKIAAYKDWHDEVRGKVKKTKMQKLESLLTNDEIQRFDLDAEFRTIAQSIDPVAAVGLARTLNADLRLFLPPPALPPLNAETDIEDDLRELLIKLPQTEVEKCVRYFTSGALLLSDEQKHKRGGLWCFGGNGIRYNRDITPQEDVELMCLLALSRHSVFKDHCQVMIDNDILQLLQRIVTLRPNVPKIQHNILRIISNICVYKQFHPKLYQSGWVSLLARMSQSSDLALRIQASRGLFNLDRDTVKEKLRDGIYVIYPRFRTRSSPEIDIVFVHGLLGGAFYTWRNNPKKSDPLDKTQCWPESWLSRDLPHCRIMCVDYDTNMTEWMSMCPHDDETKTISYRSREILDNLIKAGVGKRPIVWVCHSMGGLIVKQMMIDSQENPDEYSDVREKTKAMIFFGTPHKGSELASYSKTIKKLFYPSVEVMELSSNSPKLAKLNEELKRMVEENNLHVLSFGEKLQTNIGQKLPFNLNVVSPGSANPDVGRFILTDSNHLNVCKPANRESRVYQIVVSFIKTATRYNEETEDVAEPDLSYLL